ncbi:high-affinity choline transporter 1-like [Periplaneta americana]|uniref:high-affinity choline transporter 1-like n=1 Tax=Periplaneta americana TaxID=6978 RepID=UPI0037E86A8F
MAVFIWGAVGIAVFYVAMLGVGIWAGTKQKNHSEEEVMLAGRSIGVVVGVLTLTATWVGGAYINGTAEAIFTTGLVWCLVPLGYSVSIILGQLLFVKKMRAARYITMLDPFQKKYGSRVGGLLFLPALFGDVFWVASILNALGSSLVVILEIDEIISVSVSALFAASYTLVGGFYSISYTDVLQLFLIVIGLVLSVPFAYYNTAVESNALSTTNWLGELKTSDIGEWVDTLLLLMFGGIPWQGYMQRIFSMKTTKAVQGLSIFTFFSVLAMAIPPAMVGIIAKNTDWVNVEGFARNVTTEDGNLILPLVLRYLTPNWVSLIGLGAISAAVMSSADASILACSSMFSRNIYKLTFRPKASEREVLWTLRIAVLVTASISAAIALTVGSVYYLSYLCSDLVYVILFPQLLLVVHWPHGVNTYGCISSFIVGFLLRVLGGEHGLGIPPAIKFPNFDEATGIQKFPFRTLCMLCAIATHMLVSMMARLLFENRYLDAGRWDFLNAFPHLRTVNSDSIFDSGNKEASKIPMAGSYQSVEKLGITNPVVITDSVDDVRSSNGRYRDPACR